MKTTKTKKGSILAQYIQDRGIVRAFIAKKIGVSYPRFRTILNGADPYLHEALKISETLNAPLQDLFPHLFHNQSIKPQINSHE
jgi:transcriptional regulator with XRE-family HTH domain